MNQDLIRLLWQAQVRAERLGIEPEEYLALLLDPTLERQLGANVTSQDNKV